MKNFNIVLTGSAGFIGSSALKQLLKNKFNVTATDKKSIEFFENWGLQDKVQSAIRSGQLNYLCGDIRDSEFCKLLFNKHNVLIHQAALTSVEESKINPDLYYDVNVVGYENLVHAAKDKNVKQIIYASSSAALSEKASPYGKTKALNERFSQKVALSEEIKFTGLRYYNVVGNDKYWANNSQSVLAKWIREAKTKGTMTIYGNGEQIRDFCSIDDVVNANIRAFLGQNKFKNRILEVGSGVGMSINCLALKFKSKFETTKKMTDEIDIIYQNNVPGGVEYSVSQKHDCKDFLNFEVSSDFDKMISNLINGA